MTNHAVSNRADLRERTKTMSRHGDRRGQIADFRDSFETINWLYLLFKCGIKTKTHFEWLLWHWSSLGQLNLEPTRPNGLVGCKVPTDLVKISVKEATHMGFHYIRDRGLILTHKSINDNDPGKCLSLFSNNIIIPTYPSQIIKHKTWLTTDFVDVLWNLMGTHDSALRQVWLFPKKIAKKGILNSDISEVNL